MKVGIVGATGYSGETLVRLLSRHPEVQLALVSSRQRAGERVEVVVPRLRGAIQGLTFSGSDPEELASREEVDLFFLALPHGVAAAYAIPMAEAGLRVIDLSADFRLRTAANYREYYGNDHPAPEWLGKVPYVIPELAEAGWEDKPIIAAPGCYPTSVLLPLVPLLRGGLVDPEGIVIDSISGVSGAGKKATEYYSFCEREGSLVSYGQPKHRHLSEIEEQLSLARGDGGQVVVQFNPHLAPINRGILTTITASAAAGDRDAVYACWRDAYESAPFITILEDGSWPDTAAVLGGNRAEISALHDPRTNNFVISCAIDNLMKGASGQAVQIMNRAFGFPETAGLS